MQCLSANVQTIMVCRVARWLLPKYQTMAMSLVQTIELFTHV